MARHEFIASSAAIAAIAGLALPGQAQDAASAEQVYLQLHEAVVAYERCADVTFDQDQSVALNSRIMDIVGTNLGAGVKLSLIVEAKERMGARVTGRGCNDEIVAAHVNLFREELGPAVGLPEN